MPRVLLADDSPHAQRMGAEILHQEGFEVLGVTDGREVLETLGRFGPDLVLADASMPHHSGYEICERIKTDPALQHVKVVLLVGAFEPLDRAEAMRVRADGVLHKPFEPSVVIQTISLLVQNLPSAPSAAAGAGQSRDNAAAAEKGVFEQAVRAAMDDDRIDLDRIRGALTLAVESALPAFLDEVTARVMEALRRPKL
ncbi:MAG TPA: response regulator [Bryobacterales bacterium]|nr:response regulator [Bryobacterales bacterium]